MTESVHAEDVASLAAADRDQKGRVSTMARGLVGSEILRIAGEIRAMTAAGKRICDLTVGDFSPKQFRIPDVLRTAIGDALSAGETNYPPSNGIPELRKSVTRFYAHGLGLEYPVDSVLIAGGARPIIYAIYRALCDPGDRVVYPVPSWNNNHYVHMVGATDVPVRCRPEDRFQPRPEDLVPHLRGARLLALNTPLNPTGTAIDEGALGALCDAVLAENAAREKTGERPLFLMYDHVYWMLCFGGVKHVTPVGVRPEMARYTIFVDGISKAFAATGVRVGWAVGPVDVIERMSATLGHVGAWAPRAEQVATARLLDDTSAVKVWMEQFLPAVQARLDVAHAGLQEMRGRGLPVDSIPPMGAIYLTARIQPFGKRTPAGAVLKTNEDVRKYLLEAAGVAIVPFQAFGDPADDGWFRLSVGAVGPEDIRAAMPRLSGALEALA